MASQEHLDILKQGVEVWNRWMEENPEVRPDLDDADLKEADLKDADLRTANLRSANLTRANLIGADLKGAKLIGANLMGANLMGADLTWADLTRANVIGANLSRTYLAEANLKSADLSGANLREAHLGGAYLIETNLTEASLFKTHPGHTVFGDVDLTRARGLDSCDHLGPSIIDHRTLSKSGKLPIEFLRGCGLPDFIIDNIPVLQGDPIQFYSCFISYSTKDQEFADRLYADLQSKGIRCWFAPAEMKIGDPIRMTIYDQIRVYEKLLLILSEESVESDWVAEEVEAAFEEEKRRKRLMLFPIRLDDVVMETDKDWAAKIRRTRHIGDFTDWKKYDAYRGAFDRLIRDLKQEADKSAEKKADR